MSAILKSTLDQSVNFVTEGDFPGFIEARYVRRRNDYFVVYLSSQTGCMKACRMCHLTQTGQNKAIDLSIDQIIQQAAQVLTWYDENADLARVVHFNFMARGEPLSNQHILKNGDVLLSRLVDMALSRSLIPRFKISTIMPQETESIDDLVWLFPHHNPDIYYSIYSMDPRFRTRWLPKALPAEVALRKLKRYQDVTRKLPVLHWAFIQNENDDEETVLSICQAVREIDLRVDVNIVRYNPHSTRVGAEPPIDIIERNKILLEQNLPGSRIKVITRVGFDVKASCGMFIEKASRVTS